MGHLHFNKASRKYKHLSYRDRLKIEIMLKEKKSTREISEAIGCSQRTIQRERKRGQVEQLNGTTWEYYDIYSADYAQNDYNAKHEYKGPGLKIGHDHKLCDYIEAGIKAKKSPDVIAHEIRKKPETFPITLCTKTIYNYLRHNLFLESVIKT